MQVNATELIAAINNMASINYAEQQAKGNTTYRFGQAVSNASTDVIKIALGKEAYEQYRDFISAMPDSDCFYNDSNINAFYEALKLFVADYEA